MKCLLKFFINMIQIWQRDLDIQGYWSASFVTVCEHLMERHSYHNYSKFGLKCKPFKMLLNQMCKFWLGIHDIPCVVLTWSRYPWKHLWMNLVLKHPPAELLNIQNASTQATKIANIWWTGIHATPCVGLTWSVSP